MCKRNFQDLASHSEVFSLPHDLLLPLLSAKLDQHGASVGVPGIINMMNIVSQALSLHFLFITTPNKHAAQIYSTLVNYNYMPTSFQETPI